MGRGGKKNRTGALGPLEKGLLPLGKRTGPSGLQVRDKGGREKDSLSSNGGQGTEERQQFEE